MTGTKRCPKCGEEKPLNDFPRDRTKPDGLRCYCKVCDRERSRKYREVNKGRVAENGRKYRGEYYKANKERAAEYYVENREKLLKRQQRYNKCVKNPTCPAVGTYGAEFVTFACEVCGKEFRRLKSGVDYDYEHKGCLPRFCSRKCMGASMRKDYISPYARKIERIKKEVGA